MSSKSDVHEELLKQHTRTPEYIVRLRRVYKLEGRGNKSLLDVVPDQASTANDFANLFDCQCEDSENMNKELTRKKPTAQVRIFFKDLGQLIGLGAH